MDAAAYGKVAVLMGGSSAEREISLRSGQAVLAALLRQQVDAVAIDTQTEAIQQLLAVQPDRVFIMLHGRGGEDGVIQGALETLGLPYTGSGLVASALAMDKHLTKQIWQGQQLPTPAARPLHADSDWAAVVAQLGLPLMVKPACEGSSVGMSKVEALAQLAPAWQVAAHYDPQIFAETWIHGQEYTASILGEQVLPLIRLETPRRFYDFAAKYTEHTTAYLCPCGLPAEQEAALQRLAWQAFSSLGATGWGRVDLMLDQQGQAWLLEVNTVPGMTDHSLVPMAAKAAGLDFDALVLRILDTAWA